jgi:hypothetical protein
LGNLFAWIPYRILGFFGLYPKNTVTPHILQNNLTGLYTFFQQSYLYESNILIFILSLAVVMYAISKARKNISLAILLILAGVSYLGLFLHGDPPQHYYLVIFPVPIILLSLFIERLSQKFIWLSILVVGYLLLSNLMFYFSKNWFYVNSVKMSGDMNYVPYGLQLKVADYIARDTGSNNFNLARVGPSD